MNDDRRIVSGSKDQSLKIWDLISLQCCVTLKGHTDLIWRVAVASNDGFIVSASKDDMLKVSDFLQFLGYFSAVRFFFFNPTSTYQNGMSEFGVKVILTCSNSSFPSFRAR